MAGLIEALRFRLNTWHERNVCLFWACSEIQQLLNESERKAEQAAHDRGDWTPQLGRIYFTKGCDSQDYCTLLERYESRRISHQVRWEPFAQIVDEAIGIMLLLRVIQHDADDGSYVFDECFATNFNLIFDTDLVYREAII